MEVDSLNRKGPKFGIVVDNHQINAILKLHIDPAIVIDSIEEITTGYNNLIFIVGVVVPVDGTVKEYILKINLN